MSVLYIMIPAALILGIGALIAFIFSLRGGQYDDLDTPPVRMLFDDEGTGQSARDGSTADAPRS